MSGRHKEGTNMSRSQMYATLMPVSACFEVFCGGQDKSKDNYGAGKGIQTLWLLGGCHTRAA